MGDRIERQERLGAAACLLLIGSLVNAACDVSTTAPTSVAPALNLTGPYTLTLRTSESCMTFPDSSQTFRFKAALNQQDSTVLLEVQVTLGGLQYPTTLHGSVHDSELRFRTPADRVGRTCEAFQSDISRDETFGMCGSSVATIVDPRHITGVFTGTLEYYKVDDTGRVVSSTACSAPDHAFTLDAV
jgi:hypothetical protein